MLAKRSRMQLRNDAIHHRLLKDEAGDVFIGKNNRTFMENTEKQWVLTLCYCFIREK